MEAYSSSLMLPPAEILLDSAMAKSPTCEMNLFTFARSPPSSGRTPIAAFAMLVSRISFAARPFCWVGVLA